MNKIKIKKKDILDDAFLVASTVTTMLSGIASAILNSINNSFHGALPHFWTIGSFTIFCISLSIVLIQILFLNKETNKLINAKHDEMVERFKCVYRVYDTADLESEIHNLIKLNKVKYITITCYGTSGYGSLLTNICANVNTKKDFYSNLEVNVLICCPNTKMIKEDDCTSIKNNIGDWRKNLNVECSQFPPTTRSCVLYDTNKQPIWACMQSYYFQSENRTFAYENSLAIVGREKNPSLLYEMTAFIDDEYKRLSKLCPKLLCPDTKKIPCEF